MKKFASWNGFPRSVRNRLIDKFIKSSDKQRAEKKDEPDEITLWLNVPYIGSTGENLIKSFGKKMKRFLNTKKKIRIKTFFKTSQLRDFASTKDKVPLLSKSNVVYEVCCPGCGANYIGKTERTIRERTIEHAWTCIISVFCVFFVLYSLTHLQTCFWGQYWVFLHLRYFQNGSLFTTFKPVFHWFTRIFSTKFY